MQDAPDGCLVSVPFRPAVGGRRGDVVSAVVADFKPSAAARGDVVDYNRGVERWAAETAAAAATMTSSPQSLADSALGAEGEGEYNSASPHHKEFRREQQNCL